MNTFPPPGSRIAVYARHSTDRLPASSAGAPHRHGLTFDPAQAAIRRIHADYAAGLSPLAIAQALQASDRQAAQEDNRS